MTPLEREKKRKQLEQEKARPERQISVLEIGGSQFVVPEREAEELARRGKFAEIQTGQATPTLRPVREIRREQAQQFPEQLQQVGEQLGELGAFEESLPGRPLRDLGAAEGILGTGLLPAEVGESFDAIRNRQLLSLIDTEKIQGLNLQEFRQQPEVMSEPFLLELIKTETDFEVLKKGEAVASQLGTFVEAIPIAGSLARKYATGITTPGAAVDAINKELSTIDTELRDDGRMASTGILDPLIALENVKKYESRILELESKLRFLISQSAELKNSPEEVDAIMQRVDGIKGGIADARSRAAQGLIERQVLNPDTAFLEFQRLKSSSKKELSERR